MGGAVSSGRDNNELIDNLVGGSYIRTREVERVLRALDRADYMLREARDQAYKDLAWRHGPLHLSAPSIYSEVMEALELSPGLSFLNVGSGTGYLSTLVGLILGSGGISHGVEVHPLVVDYCNRRLGQFLENSPVLDEFDFCEPKYYNGNGLCIAPLQAPYDRVYCGAGCPEEYQNYFKQLIKVGGILVMPLNDNLVQVKRTSETEWSTRYLLNVSFATLRVPEQKDCELLRLDEQCPARLQTLCRGAVRSALRGGVCRRHPELRAPPPRSPPAKKPCPRRICIPIEDESDVEGLNALHDLDPAGGAGEMNALLSLVLSMGPSRVAGALRFDAPDSHTPPPNPTVGEGDPEPPEPPPPGVALRDLTWEERASRPGRWHPAHRARVCRGMLTFELRDDDSTPAHHLMSSDTDSEDSEGSEGAPRRRPFARCGMRTDKRSTDTPAEAESDESQSRLRTDRSPDEAGGDSGEGSSHAEGPRAPPAPPSPGDDGDVPAEVEIYLGKMAGGEATTSREMDWDAEDENEDGDEDNDESEDEESESTPAQESTETSEVIEKVPRQKLDSGIGESTPSAESSPGGDADSAGSSRRSGPDADRTDARPGRRRRQKRVAARSSSSSGSGSNLSTDGARRKRRAADGGDARRVRLSVLMKRAVKELPLPYALKKYVNLGRCFEF